MLASLSISEMAETLRVLAGSNARNAARHFAVHSYDLGDVALALLWSSITQTLDTRKPAPNASSESIDAVPIESICEGLAFQDVRYEDVDAEVLSAEIGSVNSDDAAEGAPPAEPFTAESVTAAAGRQSRPSIVPVFTPALERAA